MSLLEIRVEVVGMKCGKRSSFSTGRVIGFVNNKAMGLT